MAHEAVHEHPRAPYYIVFGVLMFGTFLTVLAAFYDIRIGGHNGVGGLSLNMPIALFIAAFKAICVILIFMHVKDSSRLTKVTVVAGLFWLLILFFLTMTDYISRPWTPT